MFCSWRLSDVILADKTIGLCHGFFGYDNINYVWAKDLWHMVKNFLCWDNLWQTLGMFFLFSEWTGYLYFSFSATCAPKLYTSILWQILSWWTKKIILGHKSYQLLRCRKLKAFHRLPRVNHTSSVLYFSIMTLTKLVYLFWLYIYSPADQQLWKVWISWRIDMGWEPAFTKSEKWFIQESVTWWTLCYHQSVTWW